MQPSTALVLLLSLLHAAAGEQPQECHTSLSNCSKCCGKDKRPVLLRHQQHDSSLECKCSKPCTACKPDSCFFNATAGQEAVRPQKPASSDAALECPSCECSCYKESELPSACRPHNCLHLATGKRGCPLCGKCRVERKSSGRGKGLGASGDELLNNALEKLAPAVKQLQKVFHSIEDRQKQPKKKPTCRWLQQCELSCGSLGHRVAGDGCPICQCRTDPNENCDCTCAANAGATECACNCEIIKEGAVSLQQQMSRTRTVSN